jgi:hypothetical protein
VTKETTWDQPVILGWKARRTGGSESACFPARALHTRTRLRLPLPRAPRAPAAPQRPQLPRRIADACLAVSQQAEKGFWFNNITGASQWELPDALGIETVVDGEKRRYWVVDGTPTWSAPTEYAWRQLVSPDGDGRLYFENTATGAVTWERPAALGWSRRSVGKTFWYDSVTGASQRDVPAHAVGHEHESGQRFFVDADGSTTWERPAAAAWTETPSDKHDGRTYFHNNVTQEVAWERPADSNVAWQQHHEEL